MKLINVQFIKPVIVGGIARETIHETGCYVEEVPDEFPKLVIHIPGCKPRGTTWLNVAGWEPAEGWEPPAPPAKGKRG